ncbi:hypothetical protein NQ318_011665 [Aromia moschata]|uniref:Fibronectin type-III domain-containing protein n=1 Tax=Aromia moschata TaxID=1265417 RepID=A0AAV8Y1L2_9CUCU|nr:hypothetical protein NQ318_011665 [Aromia moschata]
MCSIYFLTRVPVTELAILSDLVVQYIYHDIPHPDNLLLHHNSVQEHHLVIKLFSIRQIHLDCLRDIQKLTAHVRFVTSPNTLHRLINEKSRRMGFSANERSRASVLNHILFSVPSSSPTPLSSAKMRGSVEGCLKMEFILTNFNCSKSYGPNPVSNIAPLVDSNNVTLEWPRPEGRVETYIIKWEESLNPVTINGRNVSQNQNDTGPIRLLVSNLMPGVEYTFYIQTISNDLESDSTILRTRTTINFLPDT